MYCRATRVYDTLGPVVGKVVRLLNSGVVRYAADNAPPVAAFNILTTRVKDQLQARKQEIYYTADVGPKHWATLVDNLVHALQIYAERGISDGPLVSASWS